MPTARADDRSTFFGKDQSLTNLPRHRRQNQEMLSRHNSIEPVPRRATSVLQKRLAIRHPSAEVIRNVVKSTLREPSLESLKLTEPSLPKAIKENIPERTMQRRRRRDLEQFLTNSSDDKHSPQQKLGFGSNCKRPPLFEPPEHPGELVYDTESGLKLTRAQLPM